MGSVIPTRHNIDYGETLAWTPPAGTAVFYVWAKVGGDDAAMRWRRLAGWDVANNRGITITDAPTGVAITLTAAAVSLDWPALLALFDGYDREVVQITTHDADAAMLCRDAFTLPALTSTNAATIAAQERRLLEQLLAMRAGLADLKGGHISVKTPDGTEVERMPIAVVDRRIVEVRARIAWFEQAAAGNALPRAEFW